MEESIFNLIDSHSKSSKKGTLLPQHIAVHDPDQEPSDATSRDALPPIKGRVVQSQGAARVLPKRANGTSIVRAASAGHEEDAAEVARRRQLSQMRGGSMAAALAPERDNLRSKMARAGVDVKDHAQEYKVKVKEQSIINGLLKAQGETPLTRPAARKPEFSGRPQMVEPGQPNFVEDNKQRALDHAAKAREAAATSKCKPPKYAGPEVDRVPGRIPKYLIERKLEMDVEKAMALDEAERKKAGPKVMPEEERLSTLAELNSQKKAALLELNSIPISKTQLPVYQAQIKKLESRLTEIENAILLFSRKIVFVQ